MKRGALLGRCGGHPDCLPDSASARAAADCQPTGARTAGAATRAAATPPASAPALAGPAGAGTEDRHASGSVAGKRQRRPGHDRTATCARARSQQQAGIEPDAADHGRSAGHPGARVLRLHRAAQRNAVAHRRAPSRRQVFLLHPCALQRHTGAEEGKQWPGDPHTGQGAAARFGRHAPNATAAAYVFASASASASARTSTRTRPPIPAPAPSAPPTPSVGELAFKRGEAAEKAGRLDAAYEEFQAAAALDHPGAAARASSVRSTLVASRLRQARQEMANQNPKAASSAV